MIKGREICDYISLFQRTWKRDDNPSVIRGQMMLELGRACTGMLGWRCGPQDRGETRWSHPYWTWLVYLVDYPQQAWNSKTVFWASCPYSYQMVKELPLIPSPVALHPFRWQTEWSFQKAKLIQSSFHWKLCSFFPLVLKLQIYFFFLFMASKASCDLGFTGSLTPPHHCAVFSQPGFFLLSAICGACLSQSPLQCLLCRKQWFFSDLPWFQSYTRLCDYRLMPESLTVLWNVSASSADDGNTRARHVTGA